MFERKLTEKDWEVLPKMIMATVNLQQRLEAKGFSVLNTFSTGTFPACVTFIVKRNEATIFATSILDILTEEERFQREVFNRSEALLETNLDEVEREALLKRLAELEGHKSC